MFHKDDLKYFVAALAIYLLCIAFSVPVFLVVFGVLHWGFAVPMVIGFLAVITISLSE